jgi:hypothetical protein
MILTKQTTYTSPPMPGYSGNGCIDPFPAPASVMQAFHDLLVQLTAEGKTDGVQYSTDLGVSIRRWADEESALLYKTYIDNHYFVAFEVPMDNNSFVIEDIPT